MLEAYVAAAGEFLKGQPMFLIGGIKLFDTFTNRPLWLELWQDPRNLVAVDTITAQIGSPALGVLDSAARHNFFNHFREIANLIIFRGLSNVEGLIMYSIP